MAKPTREDISIFHDYGVYLPTRTIYLGSISEADEDSDTEGSGTDWQLAEMAVKALHVLDSASDDPITIIMNNPGGDVQSGLAIYDAIRACRSHVTVSGSGAVWSMGAWIMQAADHRVMAPNATMLIHYGTNTAKGSPSVVSAWVARYEKWDRQMEECFMERIKARHPLYLLSKLRRQLSSDTILTAVEAVDLGLADKVQGST